MTQEESSYSETALTQYQLDKANGMDVQLRTDIKVVVDGKMQQFQNAGGLAVYPVVFRDVIYLPVRSIGALCGKEVGWIPGDPYPLSIDSLILIFDPLTPSQLAEIQSYYSACKEQYGIIAEASNTLTSTAGLSKEDALSQLNTIKGYLGQLRTMSKPSAPIFDKWYLSVSQYVPDDMEYSRVDTYIGYMDGTIFTGKKADWDTYRIDFKGLMDEDLLSFKRSLDRMSTIVEVLSRQS